jgi:hypothetical protein
MTSDLRFLCGRYWDRTSDLFGVNEARSLCANRPDGVMVPDGQAQPRTGSPKQPDSRQANAIPETNGTPETTASHQGSVMLCQMSASDGAPRLNSSDSQTTVKTKARPIAPARRRVVQC